MGQLIQKSRDSAVPSLWHSVKFTTLDRVELLCAALRCSPADLKRVVTNVAVHCERCVVQRRRQSSRPRVVWRIRDPLRRMQRQVALWLKPHVNAQVECVTAFRDHATPFKNASRHTDKAAVLVADLANFYDTISLLDVVGMFERLGVGRQVAIALARMSTIDERLIQGGRASPYIANLVAERLDAIVLRNLQPGCDYTRYVDDLAFSGEEAVLPTPSELDGWVREAKFTLKSGSYRLTRQDDGPYVTGLHVGGEVPRAPRKIRRLIERFLYFAEKHGLTNASAMTFKHAPRRFDGEAAVRYVRGMAHWLEPIDAELAREWLQRVSQLRP